jgi:hypothetical protein
VYHIGTESYGNLCYVSGRQKKGKKEEMKKIFEELEG